MNHLVKLTDHVIGGWLRKVFRCERLKKNVFVLHISWPLYIKAFSIFTHLEKKIRKSLESRKRVLNLCENLKKNIFSAGQRSLNAIFFYLNPFLNEMMVTTNFFFITNITKYISKSMLVCWLEILSSLSVKNATNFLK